MHFSLIKRVLAIYEYMLGQKIIYFLTSRMADTSVFPVLVACFSHACAFSCMSQYFRRRRKLIYVCFSDNYTSTMVHVDPLF